MITYVLFQNMEVEWLFRAALACICGLAVGIERSKHQKVAGMRTYVIVTLGAALFTIVSKYGFLDVVGESARVDVARVSCNIVTGVSFLCAGTIFVRGDRIKGLVTSAGIWAMAAVGVAIGAGMYVVAIIATVLIFLVQCLFGNTSFFTLNTKVSGKLIVCMDEKNKSLDALLEIMQNLQMDICTTHVKKNKDGTLTYTIGIRMPERINLSDAVESISKIKSVRSIDL